MLRGQKELKESSVLLEEGNLIKMYFTENFGGKYFQNFILKIEQLFNNVLEKKTRINLNRLNYLVIENKTLVYLNRLKYDYLE